MLYATLLIFVALLSLFAFFDLIHELGNVSKDGYPLSRALLFVGLSLPGHVYELMPTAALIGTLFAIAQMVSNSEYTVMRASGASLTQITWAIIRIGIPLAIATFLAGEFLAPPAERLAQQVRLQTQGQQTRIFAQQFQSGFWFKQGRQDQARRIRPTTTRHSPTSRTCSADNTLLGVRIYQFDADMRLRGAARRRFGNLRQRRPVAAEERQDDGTLRRAAPASAAPTSGSGRPCSSRRS